MRGQRRYARLVRMGLKQLGKMPQEGMLHEEWVAYVMACIDAIWSIRMRGVDWSDAA